MTEWLHNPSLHHQILHITAQKAGRSTVTKFHRCCSRPNESEAEPHVRVNLSRSVSTATEEHVIVVFRTLATPSGQTVHAMLFPHRASEIQLREPLLYRSFVVRSERPPATTPTGLSSWCRPEKFHQQLSAQDFNLIVR
jgi:hypothetical protein